ncbi:IclR family transcriptional regulator [Actinophytocola gossypii]|uniref:IclR family transcriptional regulator n=1 Tax=Actinophytocola gossypii TaxID=2812003 RepID=A0ABT2J9C4_9PSEU|nr:IclR family transcriptional regulator [Actinophytocola gossypii]MCT2584373.1 IclR family transcriptional regulator [Actinophytocola gossypii]
MTRPRSGAQTVERALAVLRRVEDAESGLGVTELARQTGLTMSTCHRLARALTEEGLLLQDPDSERYLLGPALVALGRKAEERLGYRQTLPLLQELASATGESVNLGIRAGNDVHVVLAVASRQPLRFDQEQGSRVPLHASAMGKCLLASAGDLDEQIERLGELASATQRTITDPDRLRAELELIRERGWALNDEERNPGVRAIAAPVHSPGGEVVAAVAVQGPTVRLTDTRLSELAGDLTGIVHRVAPLLSR